MLRKERIFGKFDITISSMGLKLVPDLSDILSGSYHKTDFLELAKLAAKISSSTSSKSSLKSFSKYKSIGNILSKLDGLEFRKDNNESRKGKLITNIKEDPHRMWINVTVFVIGYQAKSHGYFVVNKNDEKKLMA